METKYVLLTLWLAVVFVWLLNHFYYANLKRDFEYRKQQYAKKQAEQQES